MINIREMTNLRPTGRKIVDEPRAMVAAFTDTEIRVGPTPWSEVHEIVLTIGANQIIEEGVPKGYVERELQRQVHHYVYGDIERALPEIIHKVAQVQGLEEVREALINLHKKVSF